MLCKGKGRKKVYIHELVSSNHSTNSERKSSSKRGPEDTSSIIFSRHGLQGRWRIPKDPTVVRIFHFKKHPWLLGTLICFLGGCYWYKRDTIILTRHIKITLFCIWTWLQKALFSRQPSTRIPSQKKHQVQCRICKKKVCLTKSAHDAHLRAGLDVSYFCCKVKMVNNHDLSG